MSAKVVEDGKWIPIGVDVDEAVLGGHPLELLHEARLVLAEAVEQVVGEAKVQARLPVVEPGPVCNAVDKIVQLNVQVEHHIRDQRKAINSAHPRRIRAAHYISGEDGIEIPVRKHIETCP